MNQIIQSGSIDAQYICFSITSENCIKSAQLEISAIQIPNFPKNTWYVNRLIVPRELRNQGIAKQLLKAMTSWADNENQKLLLEINAYGDLDRDQLQRLYQQYGFKQSADISGLFIRE